MSRSWKAEINVGLCPDRLVLASQHAPFHTGGQPLEALEELATETKLCVVLSNHFVRYAVLQWSSALTSESDWTSFAEHSFASVYGDTAREWRIRVSDAGAGKPRVACAIDAGLLARLAAIPAVVSIQPYLMAAFNARRRSVRERSFWFVVQESGRLTFALVAEGKWKLVRNRQASELWPQFLGDLLEREAAAADGAHCDCVGLCSETPLTSSIGRYRVLDLTLPRGSPLESRPLAMALN